MAKAKVTHSAKPRRRHLVTRNASVIIPVLTAIATAGVTVGVNRAFESHELASANTTIEALTRKNDELIRNWTGMTDKGVLTRRPISFQLEKLRMHLYDTDKNDKKRQHTHTVDILGINALGPIHQGSTILYNLLQSGSHLRILLLDPTSTAWKARIDQERDTLDRNAAELLGTLYGLADMENRTSVSGKKTLEVRMHAERPDRSLIIVDRGFGDGFVMGNRYREQEGMRGIEGESYVERIDTERAKEDLSRFETLWGLALPKNLPSQPFSWPKQKPLE